MKTLIKFTFLLGLMLSTAAQSAIITLSPSDLIVGQGDLVAIDINVSDLGQNVAPSLGAYDFDLMFDINIFAANSIVFGNGLDLLGIGGIQFVSLTTIDTLNIFELSFDSAATLNSLQDSSFKLATVYFNAITSGVGLFELSVNSFGDAQGNPLSVSTIDASVKVQTSVPEPATFWMILIPLVAASVVNRINRG